MKFKHKKLPTTETKLQGFWRYVVVSISLYNGEYVTISHSKHAHLDGKNGANEMARELNDRHAARHGGGHKPTHRYVVAEWVYVEGECQLRLMKDPEPL